MPDTPPDAERLIQKMRRLLPLRAVVRSELIAASRTHFAIRGNTLRCSVTQVYYADEGGGLMCQLSFDGDSPDSPLFVLPIAQVSFERGHPIARDVAGYRKRRLESLAVRRAAGASDRHGSRGVAI